jgi:hypothetical protein
MDASKVQFYPSIVVFVVMPNPLYIAKHDAIASLTNHITVSGFNYSGGSKS